MPEIRVSAVGMLKEDMHEAVKRFGLEAVGKIILMADFSHHNLCRSVANCIDCRCKFEICIADPSR